MAVIPPGPFLALKAGGAIPLVVVPVTKYRAVAWACWEEGMSLGLLGMTYSKVALKPLG